MDNLSTVEISGNKFYYDPNEITIDKTATDFLEMVMWYRSPYLIEKDINGALKVTRMFN